MCGSMSDGREFFSSIASGFFQKEIILGSLKKLISFLRPAFLLCGNSGKTAHLSRRDGMQFRFKRHDAEWSMSYDEYSRASKVQIRRIGKP